MEPLLIALTVTSLVISVVLVVLVVVLLRRGSGPAAGDESTAVLQAMSSDLQALSTAVRRDVETLRADLSTQRVELAEQLKRESTEARQSEIALRTAIAEQLNRMQLENADRIQKLTVANSDKHIELQGVLREELATLRRENEAKLEKMRETVDEKLQGTLEKRLGESFNLVSQRLQEVQKGLGEMQTLAQDVGGLKKVLTNVKNRGGWGEVQLARQLEDILTKEQYEENVAIKPGSGERVEFAVRLPGRDEHDGSVYLPIDSKFPQEDYERLLDAQERAEKAEMDDAARALERAIVEQAKTIARKYIEPPYSTDFAIMYLPTEGLFAEVVRRPGLASKLQSEHRVLITGPTTLMSLLNSLQMGFRTLAIEKRSSEVWKVLAAAKVEFEKYGQVWAKLERQLQTAQNTVSAAHVRTKAIERKLRGVETTELEGAAEVPVISALVSDIAGGDDLDLELEVEDTDDVANS